MSNKGFWSSTVGITLRWIGFIPIGLVAIGIFRAIGVMFFQWMLEDGKFFVIFLFIGGFSSLFIAGLLIYSAALMTSKICPAPKVGMIIFATITTILELIGIWQLFSGNGSGLKNSIVMAIGSVLTICIVIFSAISSTKEIQINRNPS